MLHSPDFRRLLVTIIFASYDDLMAVQRDGCSPAEPGTIGLLLYPRALRMANTKVENRIFEIEMAMLVGIKVIDFL